MTAAQKELITALTHLVQGWKDLAKSADTEARRCYGRMAREYCDGTQDAYKRCATDLEAVLDIGKKQLAREELPTYLGEPIALVISFNPMGNEFTIMTEDGMMHTIEVANLTPEQVAWLFSQIKEV